ncbi:MAG: hypothetical protein II107_00995, partial [Prevotella sp.]|nr:hypothetical protein [Prevotella sp.]
VFDTFTFYNSLILRSLRKTTGGLGEKQKNANLKIEKSQIPMSFRLSRNRLWKKGVGIYV